MTDNVFDIQATCLFGEYVHIDSANEFSTMVGIRSGGVNVRTSADIGNDATSDKIIPPMAYLCAIFGPKEKHPSKVGFFLLVEAKQPDGSYQLLHKTEPNYVDESTIEISKTKKDYPDCDYFSFHIRGMFGPIPLKALTRVTAHAIVNSKVIKCGETYFIHKADA
jgi:hypothetical protein